MTGSGCDPCEDQTPKSYKPYTPIKSGGCGCDSTDASCVNYTGVPLTCLGTNFTNKNLELVLQAINAKVCTAMGDWSGFNYNCLVDDYTITTPAEFVDAITSEFCDLQEEFTTYSETTVPGLIEGLQDNIDAITSPSLTLCSYSGVISSDTYTGILTKFANKLCDLNSRLNISSVVWNNCYTVGPPPTTLPEAFQLLSDQICQAATTGVGTALPTFNNQGSCLSAQGTADTLVTTINSMKTRICQTPVFNIDSAPWGCVANPATGTGTNLQAAFGAVLNKVNALSVTAPTFDGTYFITSYNTPGVPCSGTFVTIDPDILGGDRFVASNPSDSSPGTLIEKLTAGTNITLDDTTTPGQVIINSTSTDQLVKASNTDPSAGYLVNKLNGVDNSAQGIQIVKAFNGGTNQVDLTPNINMVTLAGNLMTTIQGNPTLYAQFCNLMCGCPDCGTSTTTTTRPPEATLRMMIVNETPDPIDLNVTLNQNSPTIGFISGGINVLASGTFNSGYFPMTTSIVSPRTVSLTLANPAFGVSDYDMNVEVLQGSSGPVIPGSTSNTTPNLNSYSNSSFSLGSTGGDIVMKVTITTP